MNNYIVRSYRDVIIATKMATWRTSKAQNIVMYLKKNMLNNINKINRLTMGQISKILLLLIMHTKFLSFTFK